MAELARPVNPMSGNFNDLFCSFGRRISVRDSTWQFRHASDRDLVFIRPVNHDLVPARFREFLVSVVRFFLIRSAHFRASWQILGLATGLLDCFPDLLLLVMLCIIAWSPIERYRNVLSILEMRHFVVAFTSTWHNGKPHISQVPNQRTNLLQHASAFTRCKLFCPDTLFGEISRIAGVLTSNKPL